MNDGVAGADIGAITGGNSVVVVNMPTYRARFEGEQF
jgi:hypothetical protein